MAALFYVSPAGLQLRSRARWFREDPAGGARFYLWRDSLSLLKQHWLLGSGPETFSVEFPRVQSRDLSRAFPEFYHESAHNMFLDTATAQGLPGLLALLFAVGLALRFRRGQSQTRNTLLAGFAAILVCHQFSVFTVPTAISFWITLAMLLSPEAPVDTGVPDRRMRWLAPLSVALLVAAARLALADRHLGQMRNALEASHYAEAADEHTAAGRLGMHADVWYSRKLLSAGLASQNFLEKSGLAQTALTSALAATANAEDPYNAWMNLGLIYTRLDDAGRTEQCIRQAIKASPNWYKAHLALARLLIATRRTDDGKRELQLARDLNPRAELEGNL